MIRKVSLAAAAGISMIGIFAAPANAQTFPPTPTPSQHRATCYTLQRADGTQVRVCATQHRECRTLHRADGTPVRVCLSTRRTR